MRKIYFLLVLVGLSASAQIVNIPDANFKHALVNTICAGFESDVTLDGDVDTNDDGEIQVSEALAVKNLFYTLPPPLTPGESPTMAPQELFTDLTGIEAFQNLQTLDVSGNNLATLDVSMLPALRMLLCANNNMTSLNLGNLVNLYSVDCGNNQLASLDVSGLPALVFLYCHLNNLNTLDVSGLAELNYLVCSNNQLTSLSFGGNSALERVYAGANFLTEIDLTDTSAALLYCNGNPDLTTILLKNGVASPLEFDQFPFPIPSFDFTDTPSLSYVCADPDEMGVIATALNGQPTLVTPYCTSQPGGSFNTIAGNITFDCAGANLPMPYVKVGITDGTVDWFTFAGADGHYAHYAEELTYTVMPILEHPEYFTITPPSQTFTFSTSGNTETANFCITPNEPHLDVAVSMTALLPARPGFDATYKIHYENKGNEIHSGSVALTFEDDVLDLVSASPATTTQSSNSLVWNFTDLLPFESREIILTFNVNSPLETPAVNIGDLLNFSAVVSAEADENPTDNTYAFDQTVVGSFDPNDKAVSRETVSPALLNEYLYYTIRFQNTGTFYAEHVVVKDVLSANLDLTTLQMVSASHSYRATLTQTNKLEFFFEGINLPTETENEPDSHGYIVYKIKPKSTLVLNDQITNTAEIYFDFNFPIITNTVTTTISTLNAGEVWESAFALFPNPTTDIFSIQANTAIESVAIYNTLGQLVKTANGQTTIDVSDLSAGSYLIRIVSDSGKTTKKLVKL